MTKSTLELHQINNKSLRERVADIIRDAIITGEIEPGQSLIEVDLAAQLGVSRAPVREAFQILDAEGLVENIPYHGTSVRELTRRDIEELYSLRSVLEGFAIRNIIAHDDPNDVAELRHIYEAMLMVTSKDGLGPMNELDRQFHNKLIELSQHRLLISTWNIVAIRVQQIMALRNMRNETVQVIAHNHLPIIEAIADRDTERALELIEQHVATAGDLLAEGWDTEL